eukprot:gene23381-26467_t
MSSIITPLLSYSFQRDQCKGGVFYNEGSNALGTLNSIEPRRGCLNGDGISSGTKIPSSRTVDILKSFLGTKDFAVEMWLRPKLNLSQVRTSNPDTVGFLLRGCNQAGYSTGDLLKSQTVAITDYTDGPALIHMSINLRFTLTTSASGFKYVISEFFINGNTATEGYNMAAVLQYGFDASTWDSGGKLNIFPNFDIGNPTHGEAGDVHSFAIFDQALSEAQIGERYRKRLANSLPVVEDSTVTIQENGESGDHSMQPEFYLRPIANNELVLVTLPVYDMEDYAYGPPQLAERPKLLISVPAPGTGQVYYPNGVEITASNMATSFITYDTTTMSYNVRIRPPLD